MTHTVAELAVSPAAFAEIADKLRAARYGHAFMPSGAVDMSGIALVAVARFESGPLEDIHGVIAGVTPCGGSCCDCGKGCAASDVKGGARA